VNPSRATMKSLLVEQHLNRTMLSWLMVCMGGCGRFSYAVCENSANALTYNNSDLLVGSIVRSSLHCVPKIESTLTRSGSKLRERIITICGNIRRRMF